MDKGNSISQKELAAIRHIRNWMTHRSRMPTIRELMTALGYKSPRSAQDVLGQLVSRGVVKKTGRRYLLVVNPDLGLAHAQTVDVPLVGMIAAGSPIIAEENFEGFVPVSTSLAKPGSKYFLLRVKGDSMDAVGIENGDLVLVRQQPDAEDGDKVVALIDDEATVKELHRGKGVIILKPRSKNQAHKSIILTRDFQIQGKVVATIPKME